MITEEQKRGYLKDHGARCPTCGSTGLNCGPFQSDRSVARQGVSCSNCGEEWQDIYTLTAIRPARRPCQTPRPRPGGHTDHCPIRLVVDRPSEPGTHARVDAELSTAEETATIPQAITGFDQVKQSRTEYTSPGDTLLELVRLAVSHWFINFAAGRDAWENSSADFNVGDLACSLGDPDLERSLGLHGIAKLTIETSANSIQHDWLYDEVLITEEARHQLQS